MVGDPPSPPKGLLSGTLEAWDAFWADPLARKVRQAADLQALTRLFNLYDQSERYQWAINRRRLVRGSMKQMVMNPLAKQLPLMMTQILALEDRFGLSPMARLKLGVTVGDEDDEELDDLLEPDLEADQVDTRIAVVKATG